MTYPAILCTYFILTSYERLSRQWFQSWVRETVEPDVYQQYANKNIRSYKMLLEFYVHFITSNNFLIFFCFNCIILILSHT